MKQQAVLRTREVTRGPVRVELTSSVTGMHMHTPDEHGYLVEIPVGRMMRVVDRRHEVEVLPGRAVVVEPSVDAFVDSPDRGRVVAVEVGQGALSDMLEALLGRTVRHPVHPAEAPQVPDRTWLSTVRRIAADEADVPPIGRPAIEQKLLVRLLLSLDHPDREALAATVPNWGPHVIRRCLDYLEAFPGEQLTVSGLAAEAGLSVRALHECWIRHREMPLTADVARIRLAGTHADLEFYRPGETTVDAIATAWGFQPSLFPAVYELHYGCPPEQTLRGPAFA
ncbi:helix-turn-helix domain-containing protein [Nocardia jiangxiensis]|uniref:Helix-turn-helix domain-containing protein n=1 Tax=Nocardia jiangxiensis TaxID=282685 RepID=A0ABW6RXC9_9NOCA|nr:AraC family transcriptional regulator [Nocardia jiangxiensis]